MNREVKISYIIPVYNGEEHIRQCLESVLSQSYQSIEIIIVNDGSSDKTKEICEEISEKSNKIKLVSQENSGVSMARNKGLNIACGEWICFVDADDYLKSDFSKEIVPNLSESLDVVFFGHVERKEHHEKYSLEPTGEKKYLEKEAVNWIQLATYNKYLINEINVGSPWGKIYRREIIKKNDIFFDTTLGRSEDRIFNFQYYEQAKTGLIIKQCCYVYRISKNSSSRTYKENIWTEQQSTLTVMKELLKYYSKSKEYYQAYEVQVLIHVMVAILYGACNKNNKRARIEKKKEFHAILANIEVEEVLLRMDRKEFPLQERIFLLCLKNKSYCGTYLLCKAKEILLN